MPHFDAGRKEKKKEKKEIQNSMFLLNGKED